MSHIQNFLMFLGSFIAVIVCNNIYAFEKTLECKARNYGNKCILVHNRVKSELTCPDFSISLPCHSEKEMTRCYGHLDSITIDFYESSEFSHFTSWLYISRPSGKTLMYDCEIVTK